MKKQLQPTKLTSEIKQYRKKHTLAETGKKFNLTAERIRQICKKDMRKYCSMHKRLYFNDCSYCLVKKYKLFMEKLDYSQFMLEVSREAQNKKRDYLSSKRRQYMYRRLYDKSEFSFRDIARLFKKDISTIKHAYNN